MSEPGQIRCHRCAAQVQPGQEYCLECGARLAKGPSGPVDRASNTVAARHGWAGAWLVPTILGLLIAVLGTGAAIAISADGESPSAISTATGGSLTVTGGTPTLTAPEPTTGTTGSTGPTTPATTAPTTTAPPPRPANPAAIAWPRDRRGWTIVLLSVPQGNGRDGAEARAAEARRGGLTDVGILNSSRFASLHPGYFVVFTGVYDSQAEATGALPRARSGFPLAYGRQIVP